MVAAVDVGILNLTNYKPPAPDDYYLGQRALTSEIRDLYGQLIDGMQGTRGQIRTGGDRRRASCRAVRRRRSRSRCIPASSRSAPTAPPRSSFDIPRVRRHRARDGGGVEQGQGRPRHGRCHRARSRGADGDAAALPAQRRSRHHASRSRQCRRRGRRLHHRRDRRRRDQPATAPPEADACAPSSAASMSLALDASGAGNGTVRCRHQAGRTGLTLARHYALDVKPATQILARRTVHRWPRAKA